MNIRSMKNKLGLAFLLFFPILVFAQSEAELVKKVKSKLDQVNDYQANGIMKIDVSFIKAPASPVKIFYKKPDKFTVKKEGGISILPKGGLSANLNSIFLTDNYTVVPAGETILKSNKVKIVKLLPLDENSNIVVTTLYIDEKEALIKKSVITTKESGTYEMELAYGKYSAWGLPDSVVFLFNTKDYKLPKGVTIEYESGEKKPKNGSPENTKGKVEIVYSNYVINKGIPDTMFN
jgi:outer membrane lipoprotein-sorting protein